MEVYIKRTGRIHDSDSYIVLYDKKTGNGLIAGNVSLPLLGDFFRSTNIYALDEEGFKLATNGAIPKEVSETEFIEMHRRAQKENQFKGQHFSENEFPSLVFIVKEFS